MVAGGIEALDENGFHSRHWPERLDQAVRLASAPLLVTKTTKIQAISGRALSLRPS